VRVTDLFFAGASHYSADQINLFDDVIARLAAAIEPMARAQALRRDWRRWVMRRPAWFACLAFDDNIEVARPVLSTSECLNEV